MTTAKNRRKFLLGSAAGITGAALATHSTSASEQAKSTGSTPAWDQIARIQPDRTSGFAHSGWPLDADPTLPQLKAGSELTVADLSGPAVITLFHVTQLRYAATLPDNPKAIAAMRQASIENARLRREAMAEGLTPPDPLITPELVPEDVKARGVILEVYYDGVDSPAVRVPLADFFADGCNGRAVNFSTPFVEKAPDSYNSFIPMPFRKSARVVLVNETGLDLAVYAFVEFESLPEWDPALGYFHASWERRAWQLDDRSNQLLFRVKGQGHLLGRHVSIVTDEPAFKNFAYVMEGNNELYIDGAEQARINYLGTEDAFGFSWGFPELHRGHFHGINFKQKEGPAMVSFYRFHGNQPVRFQEGLELRVNHSDEWAIQNFMLNGALPLWAETGRLWVDYAMAHYWYQDHIGFDHPPMPSLENRQRTVLKPNPS